MNKRVGNKPVQNGMDLNALLEEVLDAPEKKYCWNIFRNWLKSLNMLGMKN